jgi:hypothetical protein
MSAPKASLKERLLHELWEMLVIFLYLALFFCAVTTYRLMLAKPATSVGFAYGFALIKALVFAKVILLGRVVRVTRVFDDRPLIIPMLYKVGIFGGFAFAFETLEHLVGGFIQSVDMATKSWPAPWWCYPRSCRFLLSPKFRASSVKAG